MGSRWKRALLPGLLALLAACDNSDSAGDLELKAETVLPPGQSGLVTADGQAAGSASGAPGDYGEHIDDQRLLFWNFGYKDGRLGRRGVPLDPPPKDGIEVYLDPYGVPSVYAATVFDLWFGVGYVAAQQRLFIMDAVRRFGRGTAGALFGCTYVPQDIQTRTLTYTDAEYQGFFDGLHPDSKASFEGYVAGANAWLDQLALTPDQTPAEYQLLSAVPEPFSVVDLLAAGVLITRRVAAEGGDEFYNVRMLRALEQAYGRAQGRGMFLDLNWAEDRKAVTTVPADQEFPNQDEPAGGREAAFNAQADWAVTLPDTVWLGPGTGGAAEPAPCEGPAEDGTTPQGAVALQPAQTFLRSLDSLHGGSWAIAIGRSRSRDRGALLISEPQLGYTYPSYLWEAEIHGAGYAARGVSVPGLPVIGIGYSPHVAWALTTGYSKTIDSFIETACSTAQVAAGTCTANQYFHQGQWKDMICRTETVPYRASSEGVPYGSADLSTDHEVCRTVHGPVVARDAGAGLARSLSYAMWMREIDNVEGVREWNRAKDLREFLAATAKVSWNENVTFATRDGDIGYVHPGRFPDRSPEADQRLPTPGTGAFDFRGWLPFERMPKSINPEQGFLASWNNKPAQGWLDGEGVSVNTRPAGPGHRVTNLLDTLASRSGWSFADLNVIDHVAGQRDPRAREYVPLFELFHALNYGALREGERQALFLILNWDRRHYGRDVTVDDPSSTDSAAATIFDVWIKALRQDLFGALDQHVLYSGDRDLDLDGDLDYSPMDPDTDEPPITVYNWTKAVGSHRFDPSVMDNLILRVFDPASSALAVRHDWLRGRAAGAVLHSALREALSTLAEQFGTADPPSAADVQRFRRAHPQRSICSLTGVIGPGSDTPSGSCVMMPFQDRGSWVHHVAYERPG
jgi:penicillin G amidase